MMTGSGILGNNILLFGDFFHAQIIVCSAFFYAHLITNN